MQPYMSPYVPTSASQSAPLSSYATTSAPSHFPEPSRARVSRSYQSVTAAPPTNPSATAPTLTSVADQLVYHYDNRDGKLQALKQWMERYSMMCPACWFYHMDTSTEHRYAYHCPRFSPRNADFKRFERQFQFPANQICYNCLIPQAAPFGHRLVKGVRCDYSDFLKPLLYLILHTEAISTVIFDRLGAPSIMRTDPSSFTYLGNMNSGPASLVNVLEFLLVYFDLRYKRSLPIPVDGG
jgi:hypothetical protein